MRINEYEWGWMKMSKVKKKMEMNEKWYIWMIEWMKVNEDEWKKSADVWKWTKMSKSEWKCMKIISK